METSATGTENASRGFEGGSPVDDSIVRGGPERAWLVTTSKCNLNCVHCARSIPEFRQAAEATPDMEEEIFELFESQVAPTIRTIQFGGTNLGEPMISRGLEEHIQRLKARETLREVKIQTNGTYLLNRSRLERLVQLDVRVMVSLEGVTEESYRNVRGVSFARIMEGLLEFKAIREATPGSKSELLLAFTVCYNTLPELVPLVELAARVGATQVTVSHFRPVRESHRYQSLYYHRGAANAAFESASRRAAELKVHFVAPQPFELLPLTDGPERDVRGAGLREPPCFHPWRSVSVDERGDVMPCCATNAVMGNLKKSDFLSIWNGRRYRKLRKTVNSSRPPSYCRGCLLRGVNLDAAEERLYTDESYLLRSIGTYPAGATGMDALEMFALRAKQRVRAQLLNHPITKRLALGLRRLYWRLS